MQTFPVGTNAVVEIEFSNNDGDPVTPTALSYTVLNGSGETVRADTPIADLTGTSTIVTVPHALIAAPGGYAIELSITVAGGEVFVQEAVFGVVPQVRLEFLKNTFQSRASALFIANSIPGLSSWAGASRNEQETALIEAFSRITRLNFFIPWPELMDVQNRIAPEYQSHLTPRMWPLMTPSLYAIYPDYFRDALNKAQVAQANFLLTDDPIGDRRRGGLFSEKIGESSIMFKNGVRPLDETVCREAMNYLTQFINTRITLTRS